MSAAAVAEFHRRNEEARLIEARAQEPMVRGLRLTSIGLVDQPSDVMVAERGPLEPVGHRTMWIAEAWRPAVPVYRFADMGGGSTIDGPAAITSAFTTVILYPDDVATLTPHGDLVIELGARTN